MEAAQSLIVTDIWPNVLSFSTMIYMRPHHRLETFVVGFFNFEQLYHQGHFYLGHFYLGLFLLSMETRK